MFDSLSDDEIVDISNTDLDDMDDNIDENTMAGIIELFEAMDRGKLNARRLGNDFALNTGIGLRYDLGFITLRLDWGLGLHLPYDTGRSGYFNADTFGRDQTIHFAVGLPF